LSTAGIAFTALFSLDTVCAGMRSTGFQENKALMILDAIVFAIAVGILLSAKPLSSRSAAACRPVRNACEPIFFQALASRSLVFKETGRVFFPAKPFILR
jgi:hypothetical protein